MKIATMALTLTLAFGLQAQEKARYSQRDVKKAPTIKRRTRPSEVSFDYTWAQVNLGDLNKVPAYFIDNYSYNATLVDPAPLWDVQISDITGARSYKLSNAYEGHLRLEHLFPESQMKLYFTLGGIYANGNSSNTFSPLQQQPGPPLANPFGAAYLNATYPLFKTGGTSVSNTSTISYLNHFYLGQMQMAGGKQLFCLKHLDFDIYGGVDSVFFSTLNKFRLTSIDKVNTYKTRDYYKNRFWGAGPLFGLGIKVPFLNNYLRANLKIEGSLLPGYGTTEAKVKILTVGPGTNGPNSTPSIDYSVGKVRDSRHHTFDVIPAVRGYLALDFTMKNFVLSGGVNYDMYLNAIDLGAQLDDQDIVPGSSKVFVFGGTYKGIQRKSNLVFGGPFIKAGYSY